MPVTHWVSDTQVVSQAVPEALHTTMGVQATVGRGQAHAHAVTARGRPGHAAAAAAVGADRARGVQPALAPPVADAVAPAGGRPLVLALAGGVGGPAGTGVHTPADWGRAQDTHDPVQALAQQTPCAQMPDAHSVGLLALQGSPFGLRPQLPRTQTLGVAHSVSVAQRCPHWLPLQRLGVQLRVATAQAPFRQVPMAYRLAEASQLSAWQMVPLV